ncbi:hypothetical protein F5J12DRAFT_712770, partial [Pisolithus orientalis]|uniref:uncharacterized protein n=1 Tax=Pisolithus orientalis TaxID=936130 RepID=UPI002224DEA8
IGQHIIKQLVMGDTIPMLDIVQRHHDVPFYSGKMSKTNGTCWIYRRNWALHMSYGQFYCTIINAADVCGLVYTSSAGVIFIGTDIMNVNKQVPFPEKSFNAHNDAQEMFRPGDHQVEGGSYRVCCHSQTHVQTGDNNNLFNCTFIENIMHAHRLTGNKLIPPPSYSSTTPSELRLDPESTTAKLNKSLHCTLPLICATTEYHCRLHSSTCTLSPYVTSMPNTESILSTFSTPFNSHELECLTVHSRVQGQVLFITNGEQVHCWDFTGVHDKYK